MGFKFSFVRYLFLSVIIVSVGCSGLSGLREENLLLSQSLQELEVSLQGTGATVRIKDDKIAVTLPSSVFFNSGQATLKKKAKSSLAKVGNAIKNDFPYGTIRVEGHTDSDPIKRTRSLYASNWELSAKRAANVLHFLVGKCGLDSKRLYIAGFGEYQPIANNNTKKGKKQNRRVEIVILASG